jgi:transglutaminase-like putative cysteine protease
VKLLFETNNRDTYLEASEVINFHDAAIQHKIQELQAESDSLEVQAKLAFDFVRDAIGHSFDIQSSLVTIHAAEVLEKKEGICYAKAHLLAALLRGLGIPTGFCYQAVTRKGTQESGYGLHGLNAIYLSTRQKWVRVDPRGNKQGVNSEFNLEHEQLAYTIHEDIGEIDYPYVFANPVGPVLDSLKNSNVCQDLFLNRPESLQVNHVQFFKEEEVW